jgi:hypothetical protein
MAVRFFYGGNQIYGENHRHPYLFIVSRGRRGGDGMVVGFTPMQSVAINTKVVSLNLAHGEVYSTQHFVIKFVSGVW